MYNRNPAVAPYSMSQVHRAEVILGLWLKVGSVTADEAYGLINLSKRCQYWKEEYLVGIKGIDVRDAIDIDEAMFKLESQDRQRGNVTKQR